MKSLITSLLFLLFFNFSFSQSEIKISYNQSIHLKHIKGDTEFNISGASGKVNLIGAKINEYIFAKPGTYTIKIKERSKSKEDACEHSVVPKEFKVIVSRVRMTFDGNNIAFSEPIHKNIETSRITVSIPVKIETYDNKPVKLDFTPVTTAGIGTKIMATLNNSAKELRDGVHILKYSLQGMVTENSYLMFDFIDANNAVQSVALTTPIKD
jgi:hypothetical protein